MQSMSDLSFFLQKQNCSPKFFSYVIYIIHIIAPRNDTRSEYFSLLFSFLGLNCWPKRNTIPLIMPESSLSVVCKVVSKLSPEICSTSTSLNSPPLPKPRMKYVMMYLGVFFDLIYLI